MPTMVEMRSSKPSDGRSALAREKSNSGHVPEFVSRFESQHMLTIPLSLRGHYLNQKKSR
jgi:hypothetical protein